MKITLGFSYDADDTLQLMENGRFMTNAFAFRREFKQKVEERLHITLSDRDFRNIITIKESFDNDKGYECLLSAEV